MTPTNSLRSASRPVVAGRAMARIDSSALLEMRTQRGAQMVTLEMRNTWISTQKRISTDRKMWRKRMITKNMKVRLVNVGSIKVITEAPLPNSMAHSETHWAVRSQGRK